MLKQELCRHQKKFHNYELHNNKVPEDRKRTMIKTYEIVDISNKKPKHCSDETVDCHSIVTNDTNSDQCVATTERSDVESHTLSLVTQSHCGNVHGESLIRKDDALLQLLLARFTSHLTRYQRHDFCNILHLSQHHYEVK